MKKLLIILMIMGIPGLSEGLDKGTIEQKLGEKIKSVNQTAIKGILEIVTSDNTIYYIDESGRYVLYGNLIDLDRRVNVTQERRDIVTRIDFGSLPLENAIREGKGKYKLAVFHDPDCPFCRKLYRELKKMKDVEVYNFIFNLPSHPEAYDKAKKVYCADNKGKALDRAMGGDDMKGYKLCKTDVVDSNIRLSREIGVTGTPHMILENGMSLRGFRKKEVIRQKLESIKK